MTTTQTALTRDELHTLLWDITAEHADQDAPRLTPQTRLSQNLGADSLTVTELTLALEDRLGVTIPDELLDNPNLTLGQIEEALWKQLASLTLTT